MVELSAAGFEPVIVDNFSNSEEKVLEGLEKIMGKKPVCYPIDCNDYAALNDVFAREGQILGAIHFAAFKAVGESVQKPLAYYHNNLNSLLNLMQVMVAHQSPNLVFSSSCTVYGQPDTLPVSEQSPVLPAQSPYGSTKQLCEEIIQQTTSVKQPLKAISLRYFNPIGAHPSGHIGELPLGVPSNLIPFITQSAAGLRPPVTIFGDDYNTSDGTCVRDYIHVVDLAKAHVKALQLLEQHQAGSYYDVFNIGTGRGQTVLEVIQAFEAATGTKLNYKIGPRRPGDVEKIYAEVNKSRDQLHWQTELSLQDALRDAWNWQQRLLAIAK